jgi:hypothetical protein
MLCSSEPVLLGYATTRSRNSEHHKKQLLGCEQITELLFFRFSGFGPKTVPNRIFLLLKGYD